MKSYPRSRRVSDQILREASVLLDNILEDQSFGLVSVTEVSLTKDLRNATIFVSSLNADEEGRRELLTFLKERCKSFRTRLAQRITIKYMPEIAFAYDVSVERAMRIESILADINKNKLADDISPSSDSTLS